MMSEEDDLETMSSYRSDCRVHIGDPTGLESAQKQYMMRDGRVIGVAEAGDPHGVPVFLFYGLGASRYFVYFYDEIGVECRLRLICPDRPGRGISTHQSHRTFPGWVDDVEQLVYQMELPCFGLWGFSVGAVHALACAAHPTLSQKIVGKVTLCAPWVPPDTPGSKKRVRFLRYLPRPALSGIPYIWQKALKRMTSMQRKNIEEDYDGRMRPEDALYFAAAEEASRQGSMGFIEEFRMCLTEDEDLGFLINDVQVPVQMFSGTEDSLVDIQAARLMALRIPDCEYTEVQGVDHDYFMKMSPVDFSLKTAKDRMHREARDRFGFAAEDAEHAAPAAPATAPEPPPSTVGATKEPPICEAEAAISSWPQEINLPSEAQLGGTNAEDAEEESRIVTVSPEPLLSEVATISEPPNGGAKDASSPLDQKTALPSNSTGGTRAEGAEKTTPTTTTAPNAPKPSSLELLEPTSEPSVGEAEAADASSSLREEVIFAADPQTGRISEDTDIGAVDDTDSLESPGDAGDVQGLDMETILAQSLESGAAEDIPTMPDDHEGTSNACLVQDILGDGSEVMEVMIAQSLDADEHSLNMASLTMQEADTEAFDANVIGLPTATTSLPLAATAPETLGIHPERSPPAQEPMHGRASDLHPTLPESDGSGVACGPLCDSGPGAHPPRRRPSSRAVSEDDRASLLAEKVATKQATYERPLSAINTQAIYGSLAKTLLESLDDSSSEASGAPSAESPFPNLAAEISSSSSGGLVPSRWASPSLQADTSGPNTSSSR